MSARAVGLLAAAAIALGALSAPAAPRDYYNPEDFSSEALYATGEVPIGTRASALAGAYAAVADDATALHYNPAGLAQIRSIEFGLGARHQRDRSTHDFFAARTSALSRQTGLDHVAFAYPMPVYRGSFVLGFGVFRVRSNALESWRADERRDADFEFRDRFLRAQEGGLWKLAAGFGVDVLRSLSIGASLAYWRGHLEDDQFRSIDETVGGVAVRSVTRLRTEADADGIGLDFGLLGYAGRATRLALVLRSPVWMWIDGDGLLQHDDRIDSNQSFEDFLVIDDAPRLPWSIVAGASTALGPVLLTSELRYTGWDEFDADDPGALPGQDPDYSARLGARVGLEALVPRLPARLRAGYAYDPVAYDLVLGNVATIEQRQALSLGAGILLGDAFALDVAAVLARFQSADRDFPHVLEERSERRFLLSTAYRY